MRKRSGKTDARSNAQDRESSLAGAPEEFRRFLWLLENWRTYWRPLVGLALLLLTVFIVTQIGAGLIIDTVQSCLASVKLKVVHFDHSTGEVTLEFLNETDSLVPVDMVYMTVAPTNNVPMKPMPAHWQQAISVFDKFAFRVPQGAGVEIGPVSAETLDKGRHVRMAILLVRSMPPLILPPGPTITNVVPKADAFTQICHQYAPGAELEVALHTSLIDRKGRSRTRDISLGTYFLGEHHIGLRGASYPTEVDVLRRAEVGGTKNQRMVYTYSGTQQFPSLDDKVRIALMENAGPAEILLRIGKGVSGLIPVVFIKNNVEYACRFKVELAEGEDLPPDVGTWVLTPDGGDTVMNVPMAFADAWTDVEYAPSLGKEHTIDLPHTNWHVLIGGRRWARIQEGTVAFCVRQESWQKLMPVDEASSSLLFSNFNRIAVQNVHDDPSWVPFTGSITTPTNVDDFLIVQNEVKPSHSLFTSLLLQSGTNSGQRAGSLPPSEVNEEKDVEQDESNVPSKAAPRAPPDVP